MTQRQEQFRAGAIALFAAVGAACGGTEAPPGPAGTPALRGALFDMIVARTERREAFSPVKNERFGFDPIAAMRALRDDVVAADTEEALYYALARVSHARRDRHLDLFLVPGGLTLPDSAGLDVAGGPDGAAPGRAPVRIFPDYSDGAGEAEYFVGDAANGAEDLVGSRVVSVNGLPIAAWHDSATAFMRHSTRAALRWKLAEGMTLATAAFPPHLRSDSLRLVLEAADGRERRSILPFAADATLSWSGAGEPSYPSLSLALRTGTYDLLIPDDGRQFLVLIWRGFRESMVADVDRLSPSRRSAASSTTPSSWTSRAAAAARSAPTPCSACSPAPSAPPSATCASATSRSPSSRTSATTSPPATSTMEACRRRSTTATG
ncbi:MAG: hypothetical protein OXI83_04205 [Gemmatimonadota bacterium]|nr:hypothetical protein [Gemmatimonadota bacterium]